MNTLRLGDEEYILRCDLNVIDKIERRYTSVDVCRKLAAAGAVGSAAAVKFLCAEMINEHFEAAGDAKRVTEEEVGRALGGNVVPVLTVLFHELADCMATTGK